jgi:hypothetical protein
MDTTGRASVLPIFRRLYTCCPHAGCTAFREGLAFLHSYGIEPDLETDEDGNHFFRFSLPNERSLDRRRRFNESIARKTTADADPCDNCGNVMYSEAVWATCKRCGSKWLLCEECLLDHDDLCRCDDGSPTR